MQQKFDMRRTITRLERKWSINIRHHKTHWYQQRFQARQDRQVIGWYSAAYAIRGRLLPCDGWYDTDREYTIGTSGNRLRWNCRPPALGGEESEGRSLKKAFYGFGKWSSLIFGGMDLPGRIMKYLLRKVLSYSSILNMGRTRSNSFPSHMQLDDEATPRVASFLFILGKMLFYLPSIDAAALRTTIISTSKPLVVKKIQFINILNINCDVVWRPRTLAQELWSTLAPIFSQMPTFDKAALLASLSTLIFSTATSEYPYVG